MQAICPTASRPARYVGQLPPVVIPSDAVVRRVSRLVTRLIALARSGRRPRAQDMQQMEELYRGIWFADGTRHG
ncbi:MAG: hypothetical protein M0R80_25920 [Proteobacteria bacterium]|jgi:hypothetical protein|nr:hypothetical protein [Pseudomonadota bacterium]